jgi:hypothetical protein
VSFGPTYECNLPVLNNFNVLFIRQPNGQPFLCFVCPSICLFVSLFAHTSVCSPSVCPSIHLFIHPSVHLSIYPSVRLPVCLSVNLSCPSVHQCVCLLLSFCLSDCLSICLSVHSSVCPSIHLSIYPTVHPSDCPSIRLFICSFVHLYVHLSIFCLSFYMECLNQLDLLLLAKIKRKILMTK